jgi:hypothetical protein
MASPISQEKTPKANTDQTTSITPHALTRKATGRRQRIPS